MNTISKRKEIGFFKSLFTFKIFIFSIFIAIISIYGYFYMLNTKPIELLIKVLTLIFIIYYVVSYKTPKKIMKVAMFFASSTYISLLAVIFTALGLGLFSGHIVTPNLYIKERLEENKNVPIKLSEQYDIINYSVDSNGILEKTIQLKEKKSLINTWFNSSHELAKYFDTPIYKSCNEFSTLTKEGLEINYIIVDINKQIIYQSTFNKLECDKRMVNN